VVKEEDLRVQEVMGLNPAAYWMDVSDASYYKSNEKKKNKGSQIRHTKNYYSKYSLKLYLQNVIHVKKVIYRFSVRF
jgi:hypothetical protein